VLSLRLVIAGAGDFAREVLWTCTDCPSERREWRDICFLDDNPQGAQARLRQHRIDLPVIGTVDNYRPGSLDVLICAIGDPRIKRDVCERLLARGARFTNVIHPSVAVGPEAEMGHGVIIFRYSCVSAGVRLGNFVTINSFSGCGHDSVVEDYCTLSSHCDVTGHAHLESGVFLGSHAAVLPRVRVGAFAKVAAGSIAFRNVKAGATVIGVPAKVFF
jgi:sugar O-acyltransferase (sialic acid O-acetyltransferase NeuD family)